MTVLFHSGTLCPVIGSECVLSAVSLQDVMKTLVCVAWRVGFSSDESYCAAVIQCAASVVLFWVQGVSISVLFVCNFSCISAFGWTDARQTDRQTDRQTGGQRVRRTDLIFHCQLGQSSPSRPLSPDHIATYGQSPGLQTKPFSPDSRANVRWSQVEARSQLPRPRHGAEHPRGRWLCVCSGARGWVRILALSSALYGRL